MTVRSLTTVKKAFGVLETIAASAKPLRPIEVARQLDDAPNAVYQRIKTLADLGWVEKSDGGGYRLSFKVVRFADLALQQANFGERVQDLLEDIARESSEAVSLSVLEGDVAMIVRRVEAQGILRADLRVGTRLPLSASASGQVFLAFCHRDRLERLHNLGVDAMEPTAAAKIRENGYASIVLPGARKVAAVSAPVFNAKDQCVAAVTISGAETGFDFEVCREIAMRGAMNISVRVQGESE